VGSAFSRPLMWSLALLTPWRLPVHSSFFFSHCLPYSVLFLFFRFTQELEIKSHALSLLEERMKGSEAHQLLEAATFCEEELRAAEEAVIAAQARAAEMTATAKGLEREIANFGKERDTRVKAAKDKIKAAKADVEKAKKALKDKQGALQAVLAESEAAEGERVTLREQLQATRATAVDLERQVAELTEVVAAAKVHYDSLAARLEERRNRLKECDKGKQLVHFFLLLRSAGTSSYVLHPC
jgi:structural maintenance of chromosome 2